MSRKPSRKASRASAAEPRRRRTAEVARREILDAAEKRLAEGGPEALRLQEIARDLGISHPAILHHFGSRDGLAQALTQRSIERLDGDLLRALEQSRSPGSVDMIAQILATLGDSGHLRLLAWRALQGGGGGGGGGAGEPVVGQEMLRHVTDALHRQRVEHARARGEAEPDMEDSYFAVRLGATALIGDAVCGEIVDTSVDERTRAGLPGRFRRWLVEMLGEKLGLDGEDDASA